jgi:hypothetical protein
MHNRKVSQARISAVFDGKPTLNRTHNLKIPPSAQAPKKALRQYFLFYVCLASLMIMTHTWAQSHASLAAQAVPSPYRIDRALLQRTLRFRLMRSDQLPLNLPSTGEQRTIAATSTRSANETVIEICRPCGDETKPSAAQLQSAMSPNTWTDSADNAIVQFARRARVRTLPIDRDFFVDDSKRIQRMMRRLSDAVRMHFVRPEHQSHQSASEAIRGDSGDCGEMALVLAAAAKSRNIPARIVVGLVYSPTFMGRQQVFAPHVWTQVWNGRQWQSFDAALLEFDSTHIALGITDGNPDNVKHAVQLRRTLRIMAAGALPKF